MCLIEIASKLESVNDTTIKDNNDVELKLVSIESGLSEVI